MGRRSRKRGGPVGTRDDAGAGASAGTTTRAQRDAARAARRGAEPRPGAGDRAPASGRRRATDERPPPPWGKFPLSELVILFAIGLLIASFFFDGTRARTMLFAAMALGALGTLEVTVREHFGGFRSHTTLLAGAVGTLVFTGLVFGLGAGGTGLVVGMVAGAAAFGAAFWLLRRAFKRRSGGLGFKVR